MKIKSPSDCENDSTVMLQESKIMDAETLIKKMVISEGTKLGNLVRNGKRSGSREAQERWWLEGESI